ncbi:hypothetical protein FNO01nite_29580 [Flavobacterium noncentrifugens]|uniref:DUF4412 domain-containing protein n=1 Tax=Flavobacterium noncentrifugens TaxID=1128970 RepID=A0A1G8Y2X5_9FLAO|nr:hypothetical protein [Flavobacterium noncentrifugens]GEP52286.1 hypothetical protein FNO01nite_29580 [Flavobacterium noncentrifugens]SDJ97047.1 hypothetical protein SAMN04487935_2167 [Flavobacterium noncentrifugens]
MKSNLTFFMLLAALYTSAQDKTLSTASQFINRSSYVQINMDENEKATFKSGLGETVSFYPSEIIDLKLNTTMLGLQVESTYITETQGMTTTTAKETAWVGVEEIDDLVIWFEKYVIPNLDVAAGKKKTVKYIFNCEELTLKFEVYDSRQVFSVILNNSFFPDKYFWTEAKVKDIPKVVSALRYLQGKRKL